MNWLISSLRDIYWSLRHILGFWSVVIFRVIAKSLRFILVIALALGIFYLGQVNFDLSKFPSHVFFPILATASAVVLGALLLHEPARQYYTVKKEAERQYWGDVEITLQKYPTGHRFHGIVIVIRNFKRHQLTELAATVVSVEQSGLPQSGVALMHKLPQARDRVYVWEKAELATNGGLTEIVLLHLADESETYGNIPSDGKTHESNAFVELKGENGNGLIRVEFSARAGDIKMQPTTVEYQISWKNGKIAMKTETRVSRVFRNWFQPFN